MLQLQNVIDGMKEQMVRLENYCHEHRRRNRDRKQQQQQLEDRNNDNGEELENRSQQGSTSDWDPSSATAAASRDRHAGEAIQQRKKGNRLREHYDEDGYDDDGYEEGHEAEELARLLEETHTSHIMTLSFVGPSAYVVGGSSEVYQPEKKQEGISMLESYFTKK